MRPLLLLLGCVWAWAQDPLSDPGFQHFYNLEYDEALVEFSSQAAREPSLPGAYNHVAQTILFRQMFRSGALESDLITANSFLRRPKLPLNAADQRQFSDAVNRAIELSDARLRSNRNDVAALYAIGVSYGIRANYNFLVRKAWIDALSDTAAARKMHTRVTELDPGMIDARLILGVHEYVVGSLPWGWKMLGSVTGFTGDREHGIQALKLVAEKGRADRYDAAALLTAIYRREKRPREAIPLLNDLMRHFPRAYLVRLELAEMYGDNGDRAAALAQVDEADRLKRSNAPGYRRCPEGKIRYTRGNLLFGFNDPGRALEEIKAAADSSSELDPATAGYAWLRLGQIYDLMGQRQQAVAAYRETIRRSPDSDAAGEAKGYVSSRYKR
jgi:hypothetical protein